jgi:potassium-transporting ATPase KdpC subunit
MKDLLSSLRLWLLTLVVCCILYPAAVWTLGRVVSADTADGSLLRDAEGRVLGSALIGQSFTRPEYLWGRPSAVHYDASAASGSNLSPANPALAERARPILAALALPAGELAPADLVTASGSGLDPHVTMAAARVQVARIAAARGVDAQRVTALLDEQASAVAFDGEGLLVNVLSFNLALDERFGSTRQR